MWQKNAKTGTAGADLGGASSNSLILRDSFSIKCLPLSGQHFPAIPGWIEQALRPQALPVAGSHFLATFRKSKKLAKPAAIHDIINV